MIGKIRKRLKNKYEKNNKCLNRLYIFCLFALIITFKYKAYKEEMLTAVKNHLKNKNVSDKELKHIKKEILVYRVIYKVRPDEFFLFNMSKRSKSEKEDYITREMTNSYYKLINDFDAMEILNIKYLTYKVYKKLYNRDVILVEDAESKKEFIDFARNNDRIIVKPLSGHSGVGIRIFDTKDFTDEELLKETKKLIPFIAEQIIEQDDKMAAFHPKSLNTVRVVTFQINGKVSIVWSFLRVGQGDSTVDNMGSGGFGAQVDVETGKVITDAIDYAGEKVSVHPDTGIKFKGYQIPHWDELKSTVTKLSTVLPSIHCVGWDMAYSKNGWVLVEANGRAQVVTIQVLTGHGYKPLFEKMAYLCSREEEGDSEDEEK